MNDSNTSVIDLTYSFSLANHNSLSNLIIEIEDTDESFIEINESIKKRRQSRKTRKEGKTRKVEKNQIKSPEKTPSAKIGECPICCERLGKKPVSSTKCGHIFCLPCIERSLKHDKRCPQCRRVLKGACAYHPLYLPLELE